MPDNLHRSAPGELQHGALEGHVHNPALPQMPRQAPAPGATGRMMPAQPEVPAKPPAGAAVMTPFKAAKPSLSARPKGEMKGFAVVSTPNVAKQSYLRLHVRVLDGKMSILSAHEVDGPLAQSSTIAGEHAYELVLDSKPIAAEGVMDVDVSRSYPRPGQHEHHITTRKSFDFNVRVPRASIPDGALDRVALTLYRFPDASRKVVQGTIARQAGLQARSVAHLDSLHQDVFAAPAREQIRKLFPSAFTPPKP